MSMVSNISRVANNVSTVVNENINKPQGIIATQGLNAVLTMAIGGFLTKKFRPAKATFGRGILTGIVYTATMTAIGSAFTYMQEKELKDLRNRVERLSHELAEAEYKNARNIARTYPELDTDDSKTQEPVTLENLFNTYNNAEV